MKYLPLFLLLLFCGCKFPQDPKHSFKEAQETILNVGVAVHPPYVIYKNGELSGSEIDIIVGFADQENLDIDYTVATESKLIEQLEKYELHVVAAGFDKKTLWMKKAGLTVPYDKKHVLLVGKGENRLLYKLEGFIFKNVRKP